MKAKLLGVFAVSLAVGVTACNNDSETATTSTTDSSTMGTVATDGTTNNTATTSTQDYTALADTFRMNSEAGNYLDPKSGKPIKISVDPATGTRYNTDTREPVWRYVDRRTWWVYGGDNWDTLGTAKMQNNQLTYRNDDDTWVTYDKRWKTEDDRMKDDYKKKFGDTKVKISKDGDIKIKDENGKVKYDADDNKVKTDSSK